MSPTPEILRDGAQVFLPTLLRFAKVVRPVFDEYGAEYAYEVDIDRGGGLATVLAKYIQPCGHA